MTNKMVDRRTFLKTTTAAAAASSAASGAALSAQANSTGNEPEELAAPATISSRLELTIATAPGWAANDIVDLLSRDIQLATSGRLALRVSPDGLEASADGISHGNVDGAIGGLPEICGAPDLALFTGLPGDMAVSPDLLLAWHGAAGGEMFLDEAMADLGLKGLLVGHSGPQPGLWSDRDLHDLRDFATSRMETVGLGKHVHTALQDGFASSSHQISANEIDRTNLIEMPVPAMVAGAILEPSLRQFWYREGLHQHGIASAIVISRATWSQLKPSEQLIVETLARSSVQSTLYRNRINDRFVASKMMDAAGETHRKPLPADVSTAIRHTSVETVHATLSANPTVSRAFSAYGTYFKKMTGLPLPIPTGQAAYLS